MKNIIYDDVVSITKDGIILKSKKEKIIISFDECAKNYAAENLIETSKCIADRDITSLSFTFYTQPKTKLVFKKRYFRNIINGKSAVSKFFDLQKAIVKVGYKSHDHS